MSRSDYSEDLGSEWALIRWRGAVNSALRGKRGQAFLREMLAAFDALPEKRLISNDLIRDGEVCAIGAVGLARGLSMEGYDLEDAEQREEVIAMFGIADAMGREIFFMNDELLYRTSEERFEIMRKWVVKHIKES